MQWCYAIAWAWVCCDPSLPLDTDAPMRGPDVAYVIESGEWVADFDGDCDVDMWDVAIAQACYPVDPRIIEIVERLQREQAR